MPHAIFDSAADSIRFTTNRCLTTFRGHTCATSSFVDVDGAVMAWHDFGLLEGPGWAANAVGGAYELLAWARFTRQPELERAALSLLDHVLEDGFVDWTTGLIRGYRDVARDEIVLNFRRTGWFCPGSTAKVAVQMLQCADLDPVCRPRLHRAALGYARWLDSHLRPVPSNGWFPRRCTVDGTHYPLAPDGGDDPLFAGSADGIFIPQLWCELTARGLADCRRQIASALQAFRDAGGIFGSINHDTCDAHESVAYAAAFRVFLRAAQVLEEPKLAAYAHGTILPGLERFIMREDRNGVETAGLLFMEESWDTAYLWENAEAALAYLEAYADAGRREHLANAIAILSACARHHHGLHGFLTEGVDWNNHVGTQHHVDGAEFGDIRYTEPLLNNQHIVEPTLLFLTRHAEVRQEDDARVYRDHEGKVIIRVNE